MANTTCRAIRLSDEDWTNFRLHVGPARLREIIRKAAKKANRKPVARFANIDELMADLESGE